tara:strand:- start:133 stop:570 length:438 start_codon:yes stop_codon:yes gene_type:complete
MAYTDWYTQATNAAVTMNMPPALVPPTNSYMAPPRQPLVPVNAAPISDTNEATNQPSQRTRFGNLRSAGRFEKTSAMVTPQQAQAMILGDTDLREITEKSDRSINNIGAFVGPNTRTQEDMMNDQLNINNSTNNMNNMYEQTYLL